MQQPANALDGAHATQGVAGNGAAPDHAGGSTTAVLMLDAGGQVTHLGGAVEELTGQRAAVLLDRDASSWLQETPELLGALRADAAPSRSATVHVRLQGGSTRTLHARISVVRGRQGPTVMLELSPETLDMDALDGGADVFALLSADGTVRAEGRRTCRTLGVQGHALTGKNLLGLMDPQDLIAVAGALERTAQAEAMELPVALKLRHRDGSYRQLEGSLRRGLDGPLVDGVVLQATDVTEKRAAQMLRRQDQELLRLTFDLAPMGQCLLLEDGTVAEVNRAFAAALGIEAVAAQARPLNALFHPLDAPLVDAALERLHQGESAVDVDVRSLSPDGNMLHALLRLRRPESAAPGEALLLCQMVDTSDRRKAEQNLAWMDAHDTLTGLWNRRSYEDLLGAMLKSKEGVLPLGVFMLDLDGLKVINDSCSTQAGDELLRQAASILMQVVRSQDVVARLGGDEFAVLFPGTTEAEAQRLSESITEAFSAFRFGFEGKIFAVTVSAGLVMAAEHETVSRLLGKLDVTVQLAKERGRNRVVVHKMEDHQVARRHKEMDWVSRINLALEESRFVLYHQSIVPSVASVLHVAHSEILCRMVDRDGKLVPPNDFIPAAERYNLMPAVDSWLISTLFEALQNPRNAPPDTLFSINLSGTSVNDENFLNGLMQQFSLFNVDPKRICFELTEQVAVSNLNRVSEFIRQMRGLGCRFSLDDFGAGFCSFPYLKKLPVDYLKIDGSFIKQLLKDAVDQATVSAINQVGHAAGMLTIAEWVEDDQIRGRLAEMGVDFCQGWGIHKPEPLLKNNVSGDRKAPL